MAEKSLGVGGSAAATIVSTAAIGLFTFLFPNNIAAEWIIATAKRVWHAIGSFIAYPIPLGMAITVFALVEISRRVLRTVMSVETKPEALPADFKLSQSDGLLLDMMMAADGDSVTLDVLANAMQMKRLQVQKIAEPMLAATLLRLNPYGGNLLSLTPKGRDLAFEHGYTGEGKTASMLHWARSR